MKSEFFPNYRFVIIPSLCLDVICKTITNNNSSTFHLILDNNKICNCLSLLIEITEIKESNEISLIIDSKRYIEILLQF